MVLAWSLRAAPTRPATVNADAGHRTTHRNHAMMEYPIARLYTDARVQKIYGGTNEIMKELIARSMDL